MAANHRNLGETLRQPGQIHGSGFRRSVIAARQPRSAANFEPGMDVDMHVQFRGEPHDRIVIGMTASYPPFSCARIFYSDAGTVADPLFDLGATFVGITRVDGRAAGKAVFIPLQNLEDFCVVWIWGKRLFQCSADLLGDGSLDAHAFDEKIVSLVLLDGVLGCKAMKVVVPDSVGNQLVARGESVVGRVDEEFAWVHIVNSSLARLMVGSATFLAG